MRRMVITLVAVSGLLSACTKTEAPAARRSATVPQAGPRRTADPGAAQAAREEIGRLAKRLSEAVANGQRPLVKELLAGAVHEPSWLCLGRLRSEMGLQTLPGKYASWPLHRGGPAYFFAAEPGVDKANNADKADKAPSPRGEAGSLCALTLLPAAHGKPPRVQLRHVELLQDPKETLRVRWSEFPKGHLVVRLALTKPAEKEADGEVSESTRARLLRYARGRFTPLHDYFSRVRRTGPEQKSQTAVTLDFVTAGTPAQHFLVVISRRDSRTLNPPEFQGARREWSVNKWDESYEIYRLGPDLAALTKLADAALKSALALPALSEYRELFKSGEGDAPP